MSPTKRRVTVHETGPGQRRSRTTPSAMPSSVGRTTDQPTMPSTPSEFQKVSFALRAFSIRLCRAPTSRIIRVGSGSGTLLRLQKPLYQIGFEFGFERLRRALAFALGAELLFDLLLQ